MLSCRGGQVVLIGAVKGGTALQCVCSGMLTAGFTALIMAHREPVNYTLEMLLGKKDTRKRQCTFPQAVCGFTVRQNESPACVKGYIVVL